MARKTPASGTNLPVIPFSRIDCSGNELNYVREVLESGWITTASKAREFEDQFAKAVGAKYACAVNSCTSALHLACEAAKIGPGDKVFVPTMTFTATAEVIRYLGADPVFLDVEYGSCLISPERLADAAKQYSKAKAVMPVHFGGQAADLDPIIKICSKHGLALIEDAAHAFPSRYRNKMVGAIGDATCFSFYANKTITTAEGGMLTTNNEDMFSRAKVMRLHGINRDIWKRFTTAGSSWEYDVVAPGFKYNMPDLNAAVGLAQLERAEAMRDERQRCAEFYYSALQNCRNIDLPLRPDNMRNHSWHLFWIVLHPDAPISRNVFIEKMAEAGIGTSVHYKPLHRMTYYMDRYDLNAADFPNAERHWQGCVSLPIYNSLSDSDLATICSTIIKLTNSRRITS